MMMTQFYYWIFSNLIRRLTSKTTLTFNVTVIVKRRIKFETTLVCYLGCNPTICGNIPKEKSVVIGSEYRFCWFTCDDGREKKEKKSLEKGLFYLFILLLLLFYLFIYYYYYYYYYIFYVLNSEVLPVGLSQRITELNDSTSSSLLDDTNTRKSGIGGGRGCS
jgi:hypothetical protein